MGPKHDKATILEGAVAAASDDGLTNLTFGRLAKRLGINDRTIVYYFPTKADLITEVMTSIGLELQETLASAITSSAATHLDLARDAWPLLAQDSADPIFALFFEANGLAVSGLEPYTTLVPQLVEAWIEWITEYFSGSETDRRSNAEAAIVLIDGLLLLRQLSGPEAAQRAAQHLGVA